MQPIFFSITKFINRLQREQDKSNYGSPYTNKIKNSHACSKSNTFSTSTNSKYKYFRTINAALSKHVLIKASTPGWLMVQSREISTYYFLITMTDMNNNT
jgi:hypothetical protein